MKKLTIAIVVIFVIAMAVPAFASDSDNSKLSSLFKQMFEIRKQIVQEYANTGQITDEQADYMLKNYDAMEKYHEENGYTPGYGMMGPGTGCGGGQMMGGYGQGYGPGGNFAPQGTSSQTL